MNRKEIIKFLNDGGTYNKVLEIINHKLQTNGVGVDDFPVHYFMAGGSIANTIYYLLNEGKFKEPIINDIDLFYFNNIRGLDWYHEINTEMFINTNLSSIAGVDNYNRVWVGPSGESMRMVNSERFGIVNKVSINVYKESIQNFRETNYYKTLLSVFDLNCCPAGLDRINEKIVYTEDFLDFLESNMIEVMNLSQPLQTAVRLKNKSIQLGTDTSNFETEIRLIKHSFIIRKICSIGPEWLKKVKDNREFVLKHFNFSTEPTNRTDGIFNYTVKSFEIEKYYKNFPIRDNSELIAFWNLFVRKKNKQALEKVLTFYNNIFSELNGGGSIQNQETFIYDPNMITHIGSNKIFNGLNFVTILSISPNYFDCDFTVKDLEQIYYFNKYFQQEMFSEGDVFIVKTIQDHIKMIEYVKKTFIDKYGTFKKELLGKLIIRSRVNKKSNLATLDYKEKINIIKKLMDGMLIKYYHTWNGKSNLKHRFIPNRNHDLTPLDLNF